MSITQDESSACHSADPWKTRTVKITRMTPEAPSVFTYDLEYDQPQTNYDRYAPGQFSMLYVPGVGETPISIAGHCEQRNLLRYTIRSTGAVTRSIEAGGVGMSLGVRGPFGTSWPIPWTTIPATQPDVVIATGGIGLAPLRSLVLQLVEQRHLLGSVSLLVGARCPEDLLYKSELDDWRSQGIAVQTTVDRPTPQWMGQVGVVTLLLERVHVPRPQSTLVMSCGPEVMMRYVAKTAMARGIPPENIWVTLERNMNCAIGLCGHCQLGSEFICKDGPVFPYDRVRHWLRVQEL